MSIDQGTIDRRRTGFDVRSLLVGVAAIVVLTAIAAFILFGAWDDLPERVETHWNGNGEPDGFTDRGAGLVAMLLLLPAGISLALAVLMGFVPRSAPGTRWISALPVGLAAALLTMTIGSTVQQQNGGDASIGLLLLLMLVIGVLTAAAVVPLLPKAHVPPVTAPPPVDAPRLATSSEVWWTGTARATPSLVAALVALCVIQMVVIVATARLGWIVAFVLVVPALLVFANARFRVTIGGDRLVASGALIGWPRLTVPLDTIASAETRSISMWEFGGMGLRYGPRGTGVITRGGEALVLVRGDDTELTITVDDAATAAATINTLRSRSAG